MDPPLSAFLEAERARVLLPVNPAHNFGVVFFLWHRLPYHHALWHLAVLAGSVLHYTSILNYVIPAA